MYCSSVITIGFTDVNYFVNECDGQVEIRIHVNGSLQREVVVYLSTNSHTAYGESLIFL